MADDSAQWSDRQLIDRLFDFLAANRPLLSKLKVTAVHSTGVRVTFVRCHALDNFLNLIEEKMFAAKWGNLHDALAVLLAVVLLGGDVTNINQRNARNVLLDILMQSVSYEIKSRSNVTFADVPDFIDDFYAEMVDFQRDKSYWWLIFFQRRGDAKGKIGDACTDYLVVIEIATRGLDKSPACQAGVTREVLRLVEQAEKQVRTEDQFEENAFYPVPNFLPMDRLRRKNEALRKKIEEQGRVLEEKDHVLEEKDHVLEEKDSTIQEQRRELEELRKRLKQFETEVRR